MNLPQKIYVTLRGVTQHPLYQSHPLSAIAQFIKVQLAVRMVPGEISVAYPNGARLLVPPKMKGAAHFIMPRLPEFDVMSFVLHFLRTHDCFVDVGANIGAYTILAGKSVGAKTISIEASPEIFPVLERNVSLNRLNGSALLFNVAAGAAGGRLHFTRNLGTENRVASASSSNTQSVEMQSLDSLAAQFNPTCIKMDVEGYEREVIAGAAQILKNPGLQILIIERAGTGATYHSDEDRLHADIRQHGFQPARYEWSSRQLVALKENDIGNIIYVRDWALTSERIRTGPAAELEGKSI